MSCTFKRGSVEGLPAAELCWMTYESSSCQKHADKKHARCVSMQTLLHTLLSSSLLLSHSRHHPFHHRTICTCCWFCSVSCVCYYKSGWPGSAPQRLNAAAHIMGTSDVPLSPPITELSICPASLALPAHCVDAPGDVSLSLIHFHILLLCVQWNTFKTACNLSDSLIHLQKLWSCCVSN